MAGVSGMTGMQLFGQKSKPNSVSSTTPGAVSTSTALQSAGTNENAENYSNLMGQYNNLTTQLTQNNAGSYKPYTYNQSPGLANALAQLGSFSQTGGYTPEQVANLRARGISPIRSVYANAQRDIDRRKALMGGYSPGYNALKAKMAREMSENIAGATTNVEAEIAKNQISNQQSALGLLGQLNANENQQMNQIGLANAQNAAQAGQNNLASVLASLSGATNLYGTTPAWTNLAGNQNQQQVGNVNTSNQAYNNNLLGILGRR